MIQGRISGRDGAGLNAAVGRRFRSGGADRSGRAPRWALATGLVAIFLGSAIPPSTGAPAGASPGTQPGEALRSAPAIPRPFQDDERERAERSLEKYEVYLERKPYHDFALTKLVESAVLLNRLDAIVEDFEGRVERNPDDLPSRVILGRLLVHVDRGEEALELLGAIENPDPSLLGLLGSLYLESARPEEAVGALRAAADNSTDKEEQSTLLRRLAEAHLGLGQREEAAAALLEISAANAGSFAVRLEVAGELSRHGLDDAALGEYVAVEGLAGDDSARLCRALADKGRLLERRLRIPEALDCYRDALGRMARGNWLKKEMYGRILSIHQRSGTLGELIERVDADALANPQDLDAREFRARVLTAADRKDEARDVLQGAVADFPEDLALSDSLRVLLRSLDETDALVAEYQRILGEKPDQLDLYLELGEVFAADGRLAEARRQWEQTLGSRMTDAAECSRLAGTYAYWELEDEAIGLWERAIELEPMELSYYGELAAFLRSRERGDEVAGVLEQAEASAAGSASGLEQVSQLWRDLGNLERARANLEQAIEVEPGEARLRAAYGDLLVLLGEHGEAEAQFRQVIELAEDGGLRTMAIDRLIRSYDQREELDVLRKKELTRLEVERAKEIGDRNPAPYVLLARLATRGRQPEDAVTFLEELLEFAPGEEESRRRLARLYEDRGDLEKALGQWDALRISSPSGRRRALEQIARLHMARFDQPAAFAAYDEILRGSPNNAAAFVQVAQAYQRLRLLDPAISALQQAVRLEPENGEYRLELAAILRELGEDSRARSEIEQATRSSEERVVEDAREAFHTMLTESGVLDEEIEALRGRIDQNPYDVESPLTLVDLYIRELEYSLGLEMLDRLLSYQPEERRLLASRARVLGLLERHDESIADLETLAKLPEADRDDLAVKVADQALRMGDLERAAEALRSVNSAREIARVYRDHRHYDQAIEALERGAARNPSDAWLEARRAELLQLVGRNDDAAEAYERVLSLRGDSWRTIRALGDLYHRMGRRDDAVRCGTRLLDLLRPSEREQQEAKALAASWGGSARLNRGLREISTWFEERGFHRELGDLLEREVAMRPGDTELISLVSSHFQAESHRDVRRLSGILDRILEATGEAGRVPRRYTPRSWLEYVESLRNRAWSSDPVVASELADELLPRCEAGEDNWVRVYRLLKAARRDADLGRVLELGLAARPGDLRLLSLRAQVLEAEQRYGEAADHWGRVLRGAEGMGDALAQEALERDTIRQGRDLEQLRKELPARDARSIDDEALKRVLTWFGSDFGPSNPDTTGWFDPDAVRLARARCLARAERPEEAVGLLRSLVEGEADRLSRWIQVTSVAFDTDLDGLAVEGLDRIEELENEARQDPVLRKLPNRIPSSDYLRASYARLLDRQGDGLGAYDLLRTTGNLGAAKLIAIDQGLWKDLESGYKERFETAMAALPPDGPPEDAEGHADEDRRVAEEARDAGIRLAELLCEKRRWEEAREIFEALRIHHPLDPGLSSALAKLQARDDRWEEAIALEESIIQGIQARARRGVSVESVSVRRIDPILPEQVSGGRLDYVWRNLGNYTQRMSSRGGGQSVGRHYANILRILLEHDQGPRAADLLRRVSREDASTFNYIANYLDDFAEMYDFGDAEVELLRMAYRNRPSYTRMALNYARALRKAGDLEEARRVLSKIVAQAPTGDYYRGQAESELVRVRKTLGESTEVSLEDLAQAVTEDPKNVKRRLEYAERLFAEDRWEEALSEGLAAEELAPHQTEVQSLVDRSLRATARIDEIEERVRKQYERATQADERVRLGLHLAQFHWMRGERDEAEALVFADAMPTRGGRRDWSPAYWFLDQGELEQARDILRDDLESGVVEDYSRPQVQKMLVRLNLVLDDPVGALAFGLEGIREGISPGARYQVFREMASALRLAPEPEAYGPAVRAEAERIGGLEGHLLISALELANGDAEAAERAVLAAIEASEDGQFLAPVAIGLARTRGDVETALARLEAQGAIFQGAHDRTVDSSIGSISERDTFHGERGSLLWELGRKEEAYEAWAQLEQPGNFERLKAMARLYSEHGLHGDAVDCLERYLDEVGENSVNDVVPLAYALWKADRGHEALAAFERAAILQDPDRLGSNLWVDGIYHDSIEDSLFALRAELGIARDYLESRLADARSDPLDALAWRDVGKMAEALKEPEIRTEAYEALVAMPKPQSTDIATLGQIRKEAGDLEGALECSEMALEATRDADSRGDRFGELLMSIHGIHGHDAAVERLELEFEEARFTDQAAYLNMLMNSFFSAEEGQEALRSKVFERIFEVVDASGLEGEIWNYDYGMSFLHGHAEDHGKALEGLLEDSHGIGAQRKRRYEIRQHAEEFDILSVLGTEIAESEDTREPHARRIRVLEALGRRDELRGAIEEARTAHPGDLVFDAARWQAAVARDDRAVAREVAEAAIPRLDGAERLVEGGSEWLAAMRSQLGLWCILEGDFDKARAYYGARPDPRLEAPSSRFNGFQESWTLRGLQGESTYMALGFHDEALEMSRKRAILSSNWQNSHSSFAGLLSRAREYERAAAIYWRELDDPMADLVVGGSRNDVTLSSIPRGGLHLELYTAAARVGREEEVLEEFQARSESQPHRMDLRGGYLGLLRRDERFEELVAALEVCHAEDPSNAEWLKSLVEAHRARGDLGKALAHQRSLMELLELTPNLRRNISRSSSSDAPSRIRFAWSPPTRNRGGGSSSGWSSWSSQSEEIAMIALLLANEQTEEAEARLAKHLAARGEAFRAVDQVSIANECIALGAFGPAQSLIRRTLEEEAWDARSRAARCLGTLALAAEDEEMKRESFDLRMALADEYALEHEEERDPKDLAASRGQIRMSLELDLDLAEADYIESLPEGIEPGDLKEGLPHVFASLAYLRGDCDRGIALSQELIASSRARGRVPSYTDVGRLGLSLHALGRTEEALPHLREAWASRGSLGTDRIAQDIRRALGRGPR